MKWNPIIVLTSSRKIIFKTLQRKDIKENGLLGRIRHLEKYTHTHTHTHTQCLQIIILLLNKSKLFQNWEVTGHMFKYLHETCFKANPWPFGRMINVGSYFLCEDKSFYPQWYQSKLSVANLSGYGYMNGPSLVVCFLLWIFIFIFLERFLLYILGNWHYLL